MINKDFLMGYGAGKAAGGGGGSSVDVVGKNITTNGDYTAPSGKAYTPIHVNVPNSYTEDDEGKVVWSGHLITQTDDTVTANGVRDTTYINQVTVDVPNTYAVGDEGKVVSGGELLSQSTTTVTQNQTLDTTTIRQVVVDVPAGGVDTLSLTANENGLYNAPSGKAYSSVTVSVNGDPSVEKKAVNFYDPYDGSRVASFTAAEALALNALPGNPSHSGLTSQGWNYTLAQMQAQVTETGSCDIGQMYRTTDRKTKLYCHFEVGRLSPYLSLQKTGQVTIDWGDGSPTELMPDVATYMTSNLQHTYAAPGDYVISIYPQSSASATIPMGLYGSYVLRPSASATGSLMYIGTIKKVEVGDQVSIGGFGGCSSLKSITLPEGLSSSLGSNCFRNCVSLTHLTIPTGVTAIPQEFAYGTPLSSISIPRGVTVIGSNSFYNNYSPLSSVSIPGTVELIHAQAFSGCKIITTITLPASVTVLGDGAFDNLESLKEMHFKPTTPPWAGTGVFTNIPTDCTIYVPTGSLSAYTSAQNYPSSSTYTYVEE